MKLKRPEDWENFLTVGALRADLEGLPADMPVFYHRIPDVYFDKWNWLETTTQADGNRIYADIGWGKGWIRAFSAFVDIVKGKRKKVFCITAHY